MKAISFHTKIATIVAIFMMLISGVFIAHLSTVSKAAEVYQENNNLNVNQIEEQRLAQDIENILNQHEQDEKTEPLTQEEQKIEDLVNAMSDEEVQRELQVFIDKGYYTEEDVQKSYLSLRHQLMYLKSPQVEHKIEYYSHIGVGTVPGQTYKLRKEDGYDGWLTLSKNTFQVPGYEFVGWSTEGPTTANSSNLYSMIIPDKTVFYLGKSLENKDEWFEPFNYNKADVAFLREYEDEETHTLKLHAVWKNIITGNYEHDKTFESAPVRLMTSSTDLVSKSNNIFCGCHTVYFVIDNGSTAYEFPTSSNTPIYCYMQTKWGSDHFPSRDWNELSGNSNADCYHRCNNSKPILHMDDAQGGTQLWRSGSNGGKRTIHTWNTGDQCLGYSVRRDNWNFYSNGGDAGSWTWRVQYGISYSFNSPGSRTGYRFNGWHIDSISGSNYGWSTTNWSKREINWYAGWDANTYTIKYNGNGNTGGSTASSSHTYNSSRALTSNGFTRIGYHFKGWSTTAIGAVSYTNLQSVNNLTSTHGGTVNLYAQWEPDEYIIDFLNGESVPNISASPLSSYDFVTYGTQPNKIEPPVDTENCYIFTGYYTEPNGNGIKYYNSDGTSAIDSYTELTDITLYANWKQIIYKDLPEGAPKNEIAINDIKDFYNIKPIFSTNDNNFIAKEVTFTNTNKTEYTVYYNGISPGKWNDSADKEPLPSIISLRWNNIGINTINNTAIDIELVISNIKTYGEKGHIAVSIAQNGKIYAPSYGYDYDTGDLTSATGAIADYEFKFYKNGTSEEITNASWTLQFTDIDINDGKFPESVQLLEKYKDTVHIIPDTLKLPNRNYDTAGCYLDITNINSTPTFKVKPALIEDNETLHTGFVVSAESGFKFNWKGSLCRTVINNIYGQSQIIASKTTGGAISNEGISYVAWKNNKTYDIKAELGYKIQDVLVDGISQGALNVYTFNETTADHTIQALFQEMPNVNITIQNSIFPDKTKTISVPYNTEKQNLILPTAETIPGYIFREYIYPENMSDIITEPLTITAQYEPLNKIEINMTYLDLNNKEGIRPEIQITITDETENYIIETIILNSTTQKVFYYDPKTYPTLNPQASLTPNEEIAETGEVINPTPYTIEQTQPAYIKETTDENNGQTYVYDITAKYIPTSNININTIFNDIDNYYNQRPYQNIVELQSFNTKTNEWTTIQIINQQIISSGDGGGIHTQGQSNNLLTSIPNMPLSKIVNNTEEEIQYRVIQPNVIPEYEEPVIQYEQSTNTYTITNTLYKAISLPTAGKSGLLLLTSFAGILLVFLFSYRVSTCLRTYNAVKRIYRRYKY